jgi:hypothetical protein
LQQTEIPPICGNLMIVLIFPGLVLIAFRHLKNRNAGRR